MKKFLNIFFTIIGVIILVGLAVLLGIKLKNDTLTEKNSDIEEQNVQAESEYLCQISNENIENLIEIIKKDVNLDIEVADIGSLDKIDVYFVAKVDNDYKYIVKEVIDGKEKYKIADDNSEEAKYIVPLNLLGLDTCVYTSLDKYSIDKYGKITYTYN